MAYMSQENKRGIEAKGKLILKNHGMKGTFSVRHHSTLVLKLTSGVIDFNADMVRERFWEGAHGKLHEGHQINAYSARDCFRGAALAFLSEILDVMNEGNHDRSDSQSDYFDVGWYVEVRIGDWNKSYVLTAKPAEVAA